MAHFIAEYSANLEASVDFQALFEQVNHFLASTGIFPLSGSRSRAIRIDHYLVADGQHDYAFVHMTLKVGAGRDTEVQQGIATELYQLLEQFFQPLQDKRLLAISFEMRELNPILNFKSNNIHKFLIDHP